MPEIPSRPTGSVSSVYDTAPVLTLTTVVARTAAVSAVSIATAELLYVYLDNGVTLHHVNNMVARFAGRTDLQS